MKRLFGVLALLLLGVVPKPPAVTLDVKDEDVRVILKSMQQQCAVKNLIIDPNVSGKGTFFFKDVPCRTAFDTVLSTMGLAAESSDDVVAVERRR
ncbi:MAG TPA: hypothetical protein VG323_09800 [Thermoanaerobaculia bacterium]|nr:hypothetical protein [Thermoanaerobaculia bacterium]